MCRQKLFVLFFCILFLVSCGKSSESHPFVGEWKCTIDNIPIMIKLSFKDNKYQGNFLILGKTPKNSGIKKGDVIKLANIKQSGNHISFIVPLFNRVNDGDSIVFSLKINLGQLKGTVRENRKGSRILPLVFSK